MIPRRFLKPKLNSLLLLFLLLNFTSATEALTNQSITVFAVSDASDQTLEQAPVKWAIGQLQEALLKKKYTTNIQYNLSQLHNDNFKILVTPIGSSYAKKISESKKISLPSSSESLVLINGKFKNEQVLMISGTGIRGIVYGILELTDRIVYSKDPYADISEIKSFIEQPENTVRSLTRLFVSELEDKSWFYDKAFWESYLTMLISQRFNRFSLTLGLGYDAPKEVTDSYFIFAYPYFLDVPGYAVKVKELAEGEQEKNLEILQFISNEANKRGLHFQLGLWGHAYECVNSPNVNYTIEGLNDEIHPEYCRSAVRKLLQECPNINGITFRAHHESGIPDGSKSFWETVFQGVAESGRQVEIDLHSKGISYDQINMALNTGMPVNVSTKLTAEEMGLPAHQAAMREMERVPSPNRSNPRISIARYGYSDYLSNQRLYGVYHRIWPGMQKILLWGDPELASGYGRYASFSSTLGIELCDPLCFKGRQGSGNSAQRRIYADTSLICKGGNWQKYLYTYRLWGRHLYNSDNDPETYRRFLKYEYGAAAENIEVSLGNASRIVPLITSAHMPAVSAMTYWPEMYTNMPITTSDFYHPYGDTPKPKIFGFVSPLDPAMFSATNEFVEDFLNNRPSARYSSNDVAQWLENFAKVSTEQLKIAQSKINDKTDPSFKRVYIDITAQNALGMFFANKFRAAAAYLLYKKDGNPDYLSDAVYFYRLAKNNWLDLIKITEDVYIENLGFGHFPHLSGHWKDRLPAIEKDLAYMEHEFKRKFGESVSFPQSPSESSKNWLKAKSKPPVCMHNKPDAFQRSMPIEIVLRIDNANIKEIKIHYRHVNQVEAYMVEAMKGKMGEWKFNIPQEFLDSDYNLMYYFEIRDNKGNAWLYPGFEENLANQPYYLVENIE